MSRKSLTILFVIIVAITLVISSCTGNQEEQLLATTNADQTQNAQKETQAALNITQTAVEALGQTANAPTPTDIPTDTPEPTPTSEPTATEVPSPTASPTASLTPTETVTPTVPPAPTSSGAVCITEKMGGLNGVRITNNSGQDFSITLRCSAGPCMDKTNTYYKCKFPIGTSIMYVWPGRYNINWTVCGVTESFSHQLNSTWSISLRKCK